MATELINVRVDEETITFLRKQANKEGRTLSGIINKYLDDSKNRVTNQERRSKK